MPGDVFISYAREDTEFVRRLHGALDAQDRAAWIDWEDIPLSADWWKEICVGIEGADSFIFVISPDSARSVTCFKEIDHATQHNKRMLPVLRREVIDEIDEKRLHPAINAHNWVFLREIDNFETAFQALVRAIDTDLSYVREHTRLLVRARNWEDHQRERSLLLSGNALKDAEAWLTEGLTKEHNQPTALHREYIEKSRQAHNRRQQRTWMITGVVMLIIALSIWSLFSFLQAERSRREADKNAVMAQEQSQISKVLSLAAQAQLDRFGVSPERGVLLSLAALQDYSDVYVWQVERALGIALQNSRVRHIFDQLHTDSVNSVAVSPDGMRFVTASNDNTAQIGDVASGKSLATLIGHRQSVSSAAWSPDGTHVVTVGRDRTIKIWEIYSERPIPHTLPRYTDEGQLVGHTDELVDVAWSPDGKLIATASRDDTAKLWDATTGVLIRSLEGHTDDVNSAAWSPDGARLLTSSRDGTAKIWDITTGYELLFLQRHTDSVIDAVWSPDGKLIATASWDHTVMLWNATTGVLELTLTGHDAEVTSVLWSPDGAYLITTSRDRTAKVWDMTTDDELFTLAGHTDWVNDAAWMLDGTQVLTVSDDHSIRSWYISFDDARLTVGLHTETVSGVAWSPDGTRVATASLDDTAQVWDATTGDSIFTLAGHENNVNHVTWSPDGTRIATASLDDTTKIWDAMTGQVIFTLGGHGRGRGVNSAVWSPDGTRMVTTGSSTVKIWDVAAEQSVSESSMTLVGHKNIVVYGAWSPEGLLIVTTSQDGTAKVWDAASGDLVLTFEAHTDGVNDAVWSPDGTRIITGSNDNTAKVWNAASGEVQLTLIGHSGPVTGVAWSANGARVLTVSEDRTARVWDATTGNELLMLTGHDDSVRDVAWSPDGQQCVTASADGTAKLWHAWQTTGDLIAFARECCVVRDLTPDEREQFGLPSKE